MNPHDFLKKNLRRNILSLPEPHPSIYYTDQVEGEDIFLNRSEAFFPPSPKVVEALSEHANLANRYPDSACTALRHKLAQYVETGITPENIIIGNGSDGLIELLVKTFVNPQEEVIIPAPSFFVYVHATQLMGGTLVEGGRTGASEGFDIDTYALLDSVTDDTRLIFLANPNNPTGNTVDRTELETILREVACMVVVDECYYEVSGETVLDLVETHGNLIILRSLSKAFGLAGLRVGYCISNREIISYLNRADQTFPVNRFALVAAETALEDLAYRDACIAELKSQRTCLSERTVRAQFPRLSFCGEFSVGQLGADPFGQSSGAIAGGAGFCRGFPQQTGFGKLFQNSGGQQRRKSNVFGRIEQNFMTYPVDGASCPVTGHAIGRGEIRT